MKQIGAGGIYLTMKLPLALVLLTACGSVVDRHASDAGLTDADDGKSDATTDAPDLPPCESTLFASDTTTRALLQLNEGMGRTVADRTNQIDDGVFATATGPTWTAGKFGDALAFIGGAKFEGDRVDFTLQSPIAWGSAFTVEAFIRPSLTDTSGIIVSVNPVFAVWILSGKIWWRLNNSNANLEGTALDEDRWYYIATTYDGTTMRIYVDGVPVAAQPLASVTQNGPNLMHLGCAPNDGCFSGTLDEVRLSTIAIGGAAIAETAARAAACR